MAASQRLVVMTEVPGLPMSILKTEPEIVANIYITSRSGVTTHYDPTLLSHVFNMTRRDF